MLLPYLCLLYITIFQIFLTFCLFIFHSSVLPFHQLSPKYYKSISPYLFTRTSLWAAVGGGSGDAGPGHIFHSLPLHAGTPPHCSCALLPPRPQVQHQEHPFKHSGGHVFVWAGVSAWGQSDWTTGKDSFVKEGCVLCVFVTLLLMFFCGFVFAFCIWSF